MSDQPLDRDRMAKLVSTTLAVDLHARRVASLAGAAIGVLEGAALGIHAIGDALAVARFMRSEVERLRFGFPVEAPVRVAAGAETGPFAAALRAPGKPGGGGS